MRQLYMQMGRPLPQAEDPYETLERLLRVEKYDVRRIDLTQQSAFPLKPPPLLWSIHATSPSVNAGNSAARCMRAKPFFWRCRTIAGTTT